MATYSIVARDPDTGHLGVAVQSHYFAVGSMAPYARAGVGAVAIQSFAKLHYGSEGLRRMQEGAGAPETLRTLLARDHHAEYRQAAMVDIQGRVSAYTGRLCIAEAGHHLGDEYSCQGNMMLCARVWDTMAEAFEGARGELANRMLEALEAAETHGGDVRGRRSAALIVVSGKPTGDPVLDEMFDLRVEDHERPLEELRRLVVLRKAYYHNTQGDHWLRNSDYEQAIREFSIAESLAPDNEELVFWRAVALVNAGHLDEAKPLFEKLFTASPHWALLLERAARARFLPDDPELVRTILRLAPKGKSGEERCES